MSLGLVLEVAVHRHHDPPAGPCDAGVHGRVLPEVALERDHPHPRVARRAAAPAAPSCRRSTRRRRRSPRPRCRSRPASGRSRPTAGRRWPARSAAGSRSSPRGRAAGARPSAGRLRSPCAKAYRFVRIGTCALQALARRRRPGVIIRRHARVPDRPLGSAHGGDRDRGLRRHRDRFRARLPAAAQRRGRDAVGGLAPDRHATCWTSPSTTATGRRCTTWPCTPRWCCATTCWGCACPPRCSASSPSRSPTASVASCWADPAARCWRCWSRASRRWCTSPSSRAGTPPCWPPPSAACGCCCCSCARAAPATSRPTPCRRCCWWPSHPFGLFALASELVLLVVLGLAPLRHGWRSQRRNVIVLAWLW